MTRDSLAAHLKVDRYGDFLLTDAIRPAPRCPIVPREGFRLDVYRDTETRVQVPVIAAAVSREKLFDLFLTLVEVLGPMVDVILETSHCSEEGGHRDLLREHIDLPVLLSYLCEFEDLLLNDGCTGVAVISTTSPLEVQFDEHKLLVVYAQDLEVFVKIFTEAGLVRDDNLKLITEGEHLHSTQPHFLARFEQLCCRVGAGEFAERVSW